MTHAVKAYVQKVASQDLEEFPRWDLSKPLPQLPVPDLKSTMDKYLLAAKPLISDEAYENTQALVEDFIREDGEGELLQEKLREYAETKDNWCYNWWLEDMYLRVRHPLPINSNPGMVFPRQEFDGVDGQLRFAARLISGILDYKVIIDSRALPIDRARCREKGQPLCMEQYYRLFSSYRLPGIHKDNLVTSNSRLMPEPEHIIVVCKNQFFVLDVVVNFMRLSYDNLYTQLKRIVKLAEEGEEEAHGEKVGILTSADRDFWATSRMKLMEDSTNRDSLDMIERCIFILCLDKNIPLNFNHQHSIDETNMNLHDDVAQGLQMIHGYGSRLNGANRWFEKTMQFIICEDGVTGLCYEHSLSEGIAVIQLIEHLLRYMDEVRRQKLPRMHSICELPYPRKLRWKMTDEIRQDIQSATYQFDKLIANLDFYVLRFTQFGREFPKTQNMSPDSFIQLALQLTYYKVHGCLVSTYESASTRRFRLGRVDNIRAASLQALAWIKAMVGETEATDEEIMLLLRKAMAWQTETMIQTILGLGMDNHLLGLKEIATELGRPTPPVFQDSTFTMCNQFTLSTSQVPTTMDAFMGYGPVVPEGYGASYNPHKDFILFCISSFKSCGDTQSDFFAFTLESSLMQMYELCMKLQAKAEAKEASKENGTGHHVNGSVNNNDCKLQSPRRQKLVRQKKAVSDAVK